MTPGRMTVVQKIFARAAGAAQAAVGQSLILPVHCVMFHDASGPLILEAMKRAGNARIAVPERTCVIFDHAVPAPTALIANRQKLVREFVLSQPGSVFFADGGEGICHQVLYETGRIKPYDIVVGADSHTCTLGALGAFATGMGATDVAAILLTGKTWMPVPAAIRIELEGSLRIGVAAKDVILHIIRELGPEGAEGRCLEYAGGGLSGLGMEDRLTLCNMAVEAGAVAAIMPRGGRAEGLSGEEGWEDADSGCSYAGTIGVDLSRLEPLLAHPHGFERITPVREAGDVPVQQAFLGTCTNGRLSDLSVAAAVLEGRQVHPRCRLIVAPASRTVLRRALENGVLGSLIRSGAIVEHANCGPCLGLHQGVMADGETCISSSSRNYKGRMGNPQGRIYLASPATVAASAVAGKITDPREFLQAA